MTEQPTKLSKVSRIFLIVSIIGLCMMAAVLWGPALNPTDVIWYSLPDPTTILLFFGSGAVVYLVFSLPVKWDMIKFSLSIGLWGVLTLLLILCGAAVFLVFLPLVLADFASMGWFGLIWTTNGVAHSTVSATWPIWWVWIFWAINYIFFIIELGLIVWKLVPTYTNN